MLNELEMNKLKTIKESIVATTRVNKIQRGDIYYCDLGNGVGSEQKGIRPVIIIQNNIGNTYSPTVIVACITSKTNKFKKVPTHVSVGLESGLQEESVILMEQIKTISKERLLEYVGKVNEDTLNKIDRARDISMGDIENVSPLQKLNRYLRKQIQDKLDSIENCEGLLRNSHTQNKTFISSLLSEREQFLNELEDLCNKNCLDYKNFYVCNNNQKAI